MLRIALRVLEPTMECCAAQMKCRIAPDSIAIRFGGCFCGAAPSRKIYDEVAPK
jgi:hypothetical protein